MLSFGTPGHSGLHLSGFIEDDRRVELKYGIDVTRQCRDFYALVRLGPVRTLSRCI
ncbi:hypothetical protein OIDMADRAFT_21474, partial [Oidiodendron maius Zn]